MKCASCGCENREGAKFCGECAAPLAEALACPKCGTANPKGRKFCDSCGHRIAEAVNLPAPPDPRAYTPKHLAEKILTSRSALEGERKQVTILFADVRGSTELASELDPEEWHGIMDRFFQILAEGVHRFEGTVNEYRGDGIMALFGAPIAHEDHAQRACYSALHLRDALRRYADELRIGKGISFSVRMGLDSGEVVVGKIGDDLRMDYTALGHAANLAARMEQIAEPGRIYVAEATAQMCQGFFVLRDLGRHEVRGLSQPVGVFELEGVGRVRSRLEVSRARGFTKFVGRLSEMAVLEAALGQAIAGNAQVVGVVAEAGTGKSRLCYEFAERCRAREIKVYEGHGVAHGKAVSWSPILEFFRSYFGITEQDTAQAARDKIAGRMVLLDETLVEGLPLLFDFLGVPDPERQAPPLGPSHECRVPLPGGALSGGGVRLQAPADPGSRLSLAAHRAKSERPCGGGACDRGGGVGEARRTCRASGLPLGACGRRSGSGEVASAGGRVGGPQQSCRGTPALGERAAAPGHAPGDAGEPRRESSRARPDHESPRSSGRSGGPGDLALPRRTGARDTRAATLTSSARS